jgi:hypothetical protein
MSLSSALMDTADRVREFQKEADAALVEAEANWCPCYALARLEELEGELGEEPVTLWGVSVDYRTNPPVVTKHAPCCPIALAAKIRGGA